MTTKDPTHPPVAGEPVEPTGEELHKRYVPHELTINIGVPAALLIMWRNAVEAGRAFERSARERKRGERPKNTHTRGSVAAQDWDEGADTIEAWCNSGDSDEMAALRAELASTTEALDRCIEATTRLEAERDAEKARADRAEANYRFMVERAANEKLDGYRELGQKAADAENALALAKARIAELRDCGQRVVCRAAPGCARHWEERNRELVRENEVLRSNSDHLSSENAPLALLRDPVLDDNKRLTRELAEAREELRLQEPIVELARIAYNQGVSNLQAPFMALDARRAKTSGAAGEVEVAVTPRLAKGVSELEWVQDNIHGLTVRQHNQIQARIEELTKQEECASCKGTGEVHSSASNHDTYRDCGECKGAGHDVRVEAMSPEQAAHNGKTLLGGPGPRTETVADLVRRMDRLEDWLFEVGPTDHIPEEVCAERAGRKDR